MPALVEDTVYITRFLRDLRGASQPILVEASDGLRYVVKFTNNPQGRNLPFNEAMGTELYRACGLPVPSWKPLLVTDRFLDQTPECWMKTPDGRLRPEPGLCFASQFLGKKGVCLLEILPGSSFRRVQNKMDFWVAWLLDICAEHSDSRQAVFEQTIDGCLRAVFIDQGSMFSGPRGNEKSHFFASAYLDTRIYEHALIPSKLDLARIMLNLDMDRLWNKIGMLPESWRTASAIRCLTVCLEMIANASLVQSIQEMIAGFLRQACDRESKQVQFERRLSAPVLCLGV